jgi:hypothetical protein
MTLVLLRGHADVSCLPRYMITYAGSYLLHRMLLLLSVSCLARGGGEARSAGEVRSG